MTEGPANGEDVPATGVEERASDGDRRSRWGSFARIALVVAIVLELIVLFAGRGGDEEAPAAAGADATPVETRGDTATAYATCAQLVGDRLRPVGTPFFPAADPTAHLVTLEEKRYHFRSRALVEADAGDRLWYEFDCRVQRDPGGWSAVDVAVRRLQ